MHITSLSLSQVRGYEQAEFSFQPGMNLIIGVNGVGKSTVLDALRIMLIRALPRFGGIKMRPKQFDANDITNGRGALTVELEFEVAGYSLNHLIHQPRERYISSGQAGNVRDQTYTQAARDDLSYRDEQGQQQQIETPKNFSKQLKRGKDQPLAVYFSTRRSLYSETTGSQSERSGGGPTLAFADSLRTRGLRIREFTNWWLVQEELGQPERVVALQQAVLHLLDSFSNVRVVRDDDGSAALMLDKRGSTLAINQLSDGERGVLTLVLDLARRLALANPKLENPLREGQAVVLIDELDLHLHPRWQRTVVQKLTKIFPACQFIATTHSPQIIGEVAPEQIIMLEPGKQPYRPDQSLGMDSNWILEYLMDTVERHEPDKLQLEAIEALIDRREFDSAEAMITSLRERRGDFADLVRLQSRIDRIRILQKR